MKILDYKYLNSPPSNINKRNIIYSIDRFKIVSPEHIYTYNSSEDSWSDNYVSGLGKDTYRQVEIGGQIIEVPEYQFIYNKNGRGTMVDSNGDYHFFARGPWGLGYQTTHSYAGYDGKPKDLFERVVVDGTETYNIIEVTGTIGVDDNIYIVRSINGYQQDYEIIYIDHVNYDAVYDRFYVDSTDIKTNFAVDSSVYHYPIKYIFSRNRSDLIFVVINNALIAEYDDGSQVYLSQSERGIDPEDTFTEIVAVVQDSLGFIIIRNNDDKDYSVITRVYVEGDSFRSEFLGIVYKKFNIGQLSSQYIAGIVYENDLYLNGFSYDGGYINEFGTLVLTKEAILRLKHLGRIITINGYGEGMFPFKHNNKLYYLETCQNGSENQSPLVIKHKGTLYYISK